MFDKLFRRKRMEPQLVTSPSVGERNQSQVPFVDHNRQMRRAELERRELAYRTIEDMSRLLRAWKDNSLTKGPTVINDRPVSQPLTVTLNEAQIEALCNDHMRLSGIARSVQFALRDWLSEGPAQAEQVTVGQQLPTGPRP